MKKSIIVAGVLGMSLWAVDFSQMTTEQLIDMRGNVLVEDRDTFKTEMQSRLQNMTQEERSAFITSRQDMGMGQQRGMGANNAPTFENLDADGDGKITQTELNVAREARMTAKAAEGKALKNAGNAPSFGTLDRNSDGAIDTNEFQTHQQERMNNRQKSGQNNRQMENQSIKQRLQDGSGAGQMMRGSNSKGGNHQ